MHMGCPFGAGIQTYTCRHAGAPISLGSTKLIYCPFGAGMHVWGYPGGVGYRHEHTHLFRSVPLSYFFLLRAPTGPIMPPSGACGHPYGAPTFKNNIIFRERGTYLGYRRIFTLGLHPFWPKLRFGTLIAPAHTRAHTHIYYFFF